MQTMNGMPAAAASSDRCGRGSGRHGDEGGVGPGRRHRLGHGVEDRYALDVLAALARGDAGDHLGAVVAVAQPVEAALAAGQALDGDLGVLVDEDAHCSRTRPPCQLDGLAGGVEHGRQRDQAIGLVIGEQGPALGDVGAVETHGDGRPQLHPAQGLDDALGHLVDAGDTAEDVDEDRADVVVGVDDLQGVGHDIGVRAAAHVEEVGGRPADLVHHVQRAHGQPGAVGDDAHRP